jgi:hypothetical protein
MMKKINLIFGVILLLTFNSCKKEYTCVCSTSAGIPGFPIPDTETNLGKLTKKKAETQCSSRNTNTSLLGFTVTTTCELK